MKKDEVIQLWLDAEEENRNGNDEKCLEMKDQFTKENDKLSKEDQQYVKDYLDDLAG
jgi:hypothetical protein